MNELIFAVQTASEAEGGNAFFGFLMLAGIAWLIWAVCSSKPKSYEISATTKGTIKPN